MIEQLEKDKTNINKNNNVEMVYLILKRLFDIVSSSIVIITLSPIMLIVAITVKLTSKGPILFKQKRVGKNNVEFVILKFRTMKTNTPNVASRDLQNPDKYLTPIGKFLRKTSLDELPQLFNILSGDMSVVGPRPLIAKEEEIINGRIEFNIHKLTPGLTGWAQVNGRDAVSIKDKIEYDNFYKNNRSFMFDMRIIFITVFKVLKCDGIIEGKLKEHKKQLSNYEEQEAM